MKRRCFGNMANDLHFIFLVSSDEEYVELSILQGDETFSFGAATRNYILLTLARQCLVDDNRGASPLARGWMYQDDLLRQLKMKSTQLNVDIFRVRKQLDRLGLKNGIVERRPTTQQLRLNVARITIEKI